MNTKFESIRPNQVVKQLPLYFREMIKNYYKIRGTTRERSGDDVLWNNDNIVYQGKVIYFKRWLREGIVFVKQVMTPMQKLKSVEEMQRVVPRNANMLRCSPYNA